VIVTGFDGMDKRVGKPNFSEHLNDHALKVGKAATHNCLGASELQPGRRSCRRKRRERTGERGRKGRRRGRLLGFALTTLRTRLLFFTLTRYFDDIESWS
jgi:hypothetical protein